MGTPMNATEMPAPQGKISFDRAGDSTLLVHLSGPWHLRRDLPPASLVLPEFQKQPAPKRVSFDTSTLTGWASGLVSFLLEVESLCRERGVRDDREGLPAGLRRLIELAEAVPEKEGARGQTKKTPLVEKGGDWVLSYIVAVG